MLIYDHIFDLRWKMQLCKYHRNLPPRKHGKRYPTTVPKLCGKLSFNFFKLKLQVLTEVFIFVPQRHYHGGITKCRLHIRRNHQISLQHKLPGQKIEAKIQSLRVLRERDRNPPDSHLLPRQQVGESDVLVQQMLGTDGRYGVDGDVDHFLAVEPELFVGVALEQGSEGFRVGFEEFLELHVDVERGLANEIIDRGFG